MATKIEILLPINLRFKEFCRQDKVLRIQKLNDHKQFTSKIPWKYIENFTKNFKLHLNFTIEFEKIWISTPWFSKCMKTSISTLTSKLSIFFLLNHRFQIYSHFFIFHFRWTLAYRQTLRFGKLERHKYFHALIPSKWRQTHIARQRFKQEKLWTP